MSCNNNVALHNKKDGGRATRRSYRKHTPRNAEELIQYHQDLKAIKEATDHNKHDECKEMRGTVDSSHLSEGLYFLDSPLGNETPLSSNPFNVTFISVPDDTGKILKLEPSRRISGSQPYVDALKPVIRRVKAFEAQFQRGNLENSLDKIMPTIDKHRSFFRSKSTNLGVHQQRPDTYEEQVSKALEGLEFRFLSDEKQKNGDKTHPLISSKASETNTNDENREVEGGSPQKHFSIGALIKKDKIARTICPFFIAACEAHLIDPSTKVKEEFCTGVWRPLIPMCKGIKPIPPQKLPDDPITANYLLAKKVNHRGKYMSVEYSNSHTTKCGNHVKVHDVYLLLSKIKPIYSLEFYREVCIELEKSRAFEKRKKRVEERDLDFKRKNDMLTVNNVDFLANDPFGYSTATSQMNSNTGMREFTQVRPTSNRCRSSFSAASSNDDRVQSDRESNVVSWVDDLKDDGGTNTVRVHTPLPPIPTDYDPSDVLTFRWLIEGIDDRMREIDSCSDTDDSGDNDQKECNVHTKSKVKEGNNLHNPKVRLRYHFFRCYELACELCNFTLCKVMPSELYKGDFDKYKNLINKERSRIERAKGQIEEAILQLKEDKLKEHNKSLECDLPLVTVSCKSSSSIYSHGQVRDPSLLNSEVTSKYSLDQRPHSVGRTGSKAGDTSIFNSSPQEIEENLEIIRSRLRAVRALSNLSRERLSQLTHNTTDLCVDDHSLNKADTVDDRLSETSSQTRSSVSCVTSCETGKSVSITHESTSKKHNKTPLESLLEMTTSLEASFNGSVANDRSKIGNIRRKMKHLSSKSQTLQAAADQHELWLSLATYRLTRPPLHACAHLAGQPLEDEQEMKKQVLDLKNAKKIKATAKKQSVDKIKKDSGNSGEDENKADESTTQCNISNMENFQKPQDTILPILGLLEVFSIFSDGAAYICGEDDVKLSKSEQQAALSELVNCLYTDDGRAREDTHTNRDSQSHRQVGVLQRFVGSVEGSLLKEMAVHYSAFIAAINDPVLGMFGNTGGAAVTRSSKTANGETIKTDSRRNTEEEENELLPKIFKTIYSKRRVIASAAPRILIDAVLGYVCSVAGSPNPEGGAANQYYPSDLSYGQSDYTTNESKEQQKRHSQIRSTVSEIKHYYQEIEFNNSFLKCQSSVSRGFRKKKKDDQSLSTIEHRISGVVEAPIDGLKPITAIFPPRTGTLKTQDNEDRASAPTTPNIQGHSFIDNTENIEPLTPHFQEPSSFRPLIDLHQIVKNNTYLATTTAEERLRMHFLANARNSKLFEEVILRLRGELVFLFTGIDTRRTLLSKQSIRELNTYKIWQKTPHITSDTTRVISLQQITSNSQGAKVRLPKPPCNRNLLTDNLLSKRSPSSNSRHSRTPNEHNCMVITINDEQMASIKNDNIDELLNSEARKDVAETLLQDMRTPQGNTLTGEGIYRDETPRCTSVITCSSMRSRSRTRLDAGRSVKSSPKEQHFVESLAMFDQTKKSALIAPDEPLSKSHSENKMKTITLLDNNTTSAISHSTMVDTKQGRQISGKQGCRFPKTVSPKKDPIDRVPRPPSIFVAPKSIHRKIFSKTLQSMRKRTVPVGTVGGKEVLKNIDIFRAASPKGFNHLLPLRDNSEGMDERSNHKTEITSRSPSPKFAKMSPKYHNSSTSNFSFAQQMQQDQQYVMHRSLSKYHDNIILQVTPAVERQEMESFKDVMIALERVRRGTSTHIPEVPKAKLHEELVNNKNDKHLTLTVDDLEVLRKYRTEYAMENITPVNLVLLRRRKQINHYKMMKRQIAIQNGTDGVVNSSLGYIPKKTKSIPVLLLTSQKAATPKRHYRLSPTAIDEDYNDVEPKAYTKEASPKINRHHLSLADRPQSNSITEAYYNHLQKGSEFRKNMMKSSLTPIQRWELHRESVIKNRNDPDISKKIHNIVNFRIRPGLSTGNIGDEIQAVLQLLNKGLLEARLRKYLPYNDFVIGSPSFISKFVQTADMSCQGNTNKLVVMESNKPPNPEQEQEALGGYVYDKKRKAFVYCFFSKTNKVPGIVPANEDSIIVEKNLSVTESVVGLKGSVAVEKYKYAATHAMSSSCLGAQNNVLQRGTFDVHQVTPLTALWSKTLSSASSSDVPQQAQSLTSPKRSPTAVIVNVKKTNPHYLVEWTY